MGTVKGERLLFVDASTYTVETIRPCHAIVEVDHNFDVDSEDFLADPLTALESTHGVLVATLWDAYRLVHELELGHLLTDVDETETTLMFRVDGDGEELEGIITERFCSSPADINGLSVPLVASDLPAVLVDCGDRGSWLVPLSWQVTR